MVVWHGTTPQRKGPTVIYSFDLTSNAETGLVELAAHVDSQLLTVEFCDNVTGVPIATYALKDALDVAYAGNGLAFRLGDPRLSASRDTMALFAAFVDTTDIPHL
jgi:hypothetical protein